ncbi:unannotated protein [freshwater metagenome]|uniref:Unannotated protein n=1 Tax=freshwater metagenome TaxID=449393 RepID=A0A6J6VK23_9ZZZZ
MPPYCDAICRAVALAAGIHVALGLSGSFAEVNLQPNTPRLPRTLIAESMFCITSAITVRSDQ